MILYPVFYRQRGILRFDQLTAPRLSPLNLFELPRESILHYYPVDDYRFGPGLNDFWVLKADGQIFIDHVTEMVAKEGAPRSTHVYPTMMIRDYRKLHRRFRPLINIETASRDAKNIIVRNYAMMPHMWRYRAHMLSNYYAWYNVRKTFWEGVEEFGKDTTRQQYVFMQFPARIPNRAEFNKMAATVNRESLKAFNNPDALNLFDLWQWLGDDRERSLMSVLSEHTLENLNIVFLESGKWTVINLGLLNRWRKLDKADLEKMAPDERAEAEKLSAQGKNSHIVQMRLLGMVNNILKARTVTASGAVVEDVPETPEQLPEVVAVTNPDDDALVEPVAEESSVKVKGKSTDTVVGQPQIVNIINKAPEEKVEAEVKHTAELSDGAMIGDNADVTVTYDEDEDENAEVPELDNIAEVMGVDVDEDDDHSGSVSEAAWQSIGQVADPRYLPAKNNFEEYSGGVMKRAKELADIGLLTGPEYRRFERLSTAFERIPNPVGTGTLKEMAEIHPAMITAINEQDMPDSDTIIDKSMLKSTLLDYDAQYVKNLLPRNVAQMVLQLQKAGVAVTEYKVQRVRDVMGETDQYAVKLVPVAGQPSTFKFSLPVIQPNGVYMSGGVKYRLRRQRGDMPIRKVKSNQVALTSYYGKLFVTRGERVVQNYGKWLKEQVQAAIVQDDSQVEGITYGQHFYPYKRLPRAYTAISQQYGAFTWNTAKDEREDGLTGFTFHWDYKNRAKHFSDEVLAQFESDDVVVVGMASNGKDAMTITMDMTDTMYLNKPGGALEVLGTVEELMLFDYERAPIEYCELKVLGKPITVGFILAYYYGLGKLCRMLGVEPRRVPRGAQMNLEKDEWALRFNDETLIFDRNNRLALQVLAGFKTYHRQIANYSVLSFDNPEVYGNVLAGMGLGHKYMRELDTLRALFVDHITKDLLIMQKEPTNFDGLLVRSCELLMTDDTPDETDHKFQVERGYERFAGAVYQELVKGYRSYYANPVSSRASIAIPHSAVFQAIQNDSSQILVNDSNPIHNLKEKEASTFNGTNGRSGRTMAKRSRVFHPNDRGIISEATVDNSDVAVNTYLSANPKLTSLYGTVGLFDDNSDGMTRQLSTSALVSPGATNDDPKRVNFINIQHSSGIAAAGYVIPPLLTGYEQVIPHRVDDMFAHTAKADGVVVKRDRDHVVVSYPGTDLPDEAVRIGTVHGVSAGTVIPHEIRTFMKVGDKFTRGAAIAYNTGFFKPDPMNPGRVSYAGSAIANTALMETADTTDDSSAISQEMSERMATRTCKVRTLVLTFDQAIRNLVEPGDPVTADSILCNIEDPLAADYDLFSDESVSALRMLAANSPRAKYPGIVDKIEIVYNGAIDNMSDSLKAHTEESDDRRAALARKLKSGDAINGQVTGYGRIDGTTLEPNTLAIRIYIVGSNGAGAGDKAVFGHQLKTVIRRVLTGKHETESGQPIDAIFGYSSIDNRIVNSAVKVGTTNTTLMVLGKRAVQAYRGEEIHYGDKTYGGKSTGKGTAL